MSQAPCDHDPRALASLPAAAAPVVHAAARIFRALGDPGRLRVLEVLLLGERCVSEIAAMLTVELPTVSARLRILRAEGLVRSRRDGRHIHYRLADAHVRDLVATALEHASEPPHPEDPEDAP